jgi:ABC-type lipoprotein export system ATPase subunit
VVHVLDALELEVNTGATLAVMAPRGCANSTLLHLLSGLQRLTAGKV